MEYDQNFGQGSLLTAIQSTIHGKVIKPITNSCEQDRVSLKSEETRAGVMMENYYKSNWMLMDHIAKQFGKVQRRDTRTQKIKLSPRQLGGARAITTLPNLYVSMKLFDVSKWVCLSG